MRSRFLAGIACLFISLAAHAQSRSFKDDKLFRFKCDATFQIRRHLADTSTGTALLLKHDHADVWEVLFQYKPKPAKPDPTSDPWDPCMVLDKDTMYAISFPVALTSKDRDMMFQLDFSGKVIDPNEERKAWTTLPDNKATILLNATKLKKDIKLKSISPDVKGRITAEEGKGTPPMVTFNWHKK